MRPIVEQHGLHYWGATSPGFFQTGPFPKIAVRWGGRQSEIAGISGEYWTYRIVRLRTAEGTVREVWAQLFFECFKPKEVEWIPPLSSLANADRTCEN